MEEKEVKTRFLASLFVAFKDRIRKRVNLIEAGIKIGGTVLTALLGYDIYTFLTGPAFTKRYRLGLDMPSPDPAPMYYYIFRGEIPRGASIIPPRPQERNGGTTSIPTRPLNFLDYLQLFSPLITALTTLILVRGIHYWRRKELEKALQKLERMEIRK